MCAANRFTNFEPQQYISQYIPHNYDLIQGVGEAKQRNFDKGVKDLEDTQSLFKINAAPQDVQDRDKKLKDYNDQLTQMANKYYDTGDKSNLNKLRQVANQFQNDPERQTLEANAKDYYDNYQKDRDKLGLGYRDIYDPIYGKNGYDSYRKAGGKLKRINYTNMLGFEDYSEPGQKLVSDIAKDQTAWSGAQGFDEKGLYKITKGTKEYISDDKVKEIASKNAEALLTGKGGQWFVDELLNQHAPGAGHQDYTTLPDNLKAGIKQQASNYLYNLAIKQKFTKQTSDLGLHNMSEYATDKLKQKDLADPANIQTFWGNRQENTNTQDPLKGTGLEGIQLDEKGNVKEKVPSNIVLGGPTVGGTGMPGFASTGEGKSTKESKEELDKYNEILNKYRSENPALTNATNPQVIKAITEVRNNMTQVHNLSFDIPNLDPKKLTERILSNIDGLGFKVQGDETTGFADLKNVSDKLDLDEETFEKKLANSTIGKISPANNGSYELQIADSKGLPQTVYIKGSEQMQKHFATATQIAELEKEGKVGETKLNDKTGVKIELKNDQQQGWHYETKVYTRLTDKETQDYIKGSGQTKTSLEEQGVNFNSNGNIVIEENPESYFKALQSDWISSNYELPNRYNFSKNTNTAQ